MVSSPGLRFFFKVNGRLNMEVVKFFTYTFIRFSCQILLCSSHLVLSYFFLGGHSFSFFVSACVQTSCHLLGPMITELFPLSEVDASC